MEKQTVFDSVESESELLEGLADEIWDRAELSLEEDESSSALATALAKKGFDVDVGVAGMPTAFVARYGTDRPVIGTIGEYDALPSLSQRVKGEREPREPGAPGHGCGHNLFGAASLVAAVAVKRAIQRGDVEGSVVYFGCPAEEILIGKPYMANEGLFDEVDAIVTWHPGRLNTPRLETCTALNSVVVRYEGTASHTGAAPESGRSALDGVQLLNTGVEYMREHVVDGTRISYVIVDGGDSPGVVPADAAVWYTIRAPDRKTVDFVTEWLEDVAAGAATMTRTAVDVTRLTGTYGFRPNETITDAIFENMQAVGPITYDEDERRLASELRETVGEETVRSQMAGYHVPDDLFEEISENDVYGEPIRPFDEGCVGTFSSDTGNVTRIVPVGRFKAATWPIGTPGHSWQAVAASGSGIGRKGALFAAKVLAGTMYDLISDEQLLDDAIEEFRESADGYKSPIPSGKRAPIELVKRLHR